MTFPPPLRHNKIIDNTAKFCMVMVRSYCVRGEMKLISEQDIDRVVEHLGRIERTPFERLFILLSEEQPAVAGFIKNIDNEDFRPDEKNLLTHVSVIAWHVISETLGASVRKSADFIEYLLERNMDLFEELEDESGEDEGFFDGIFSEFNEQPLLMRFLAGMVIDRPDFYEGVIREEMVPLVLLYVKTVVDALLMDEEQWLEDDEEVVEYSDEDFRRVREQTAGLYERYAQSPHFGRLDNGSRQNAEMVVTSFSDFMYNYYLLKPSGWNVRRAAECCVEIMPRKVAAPAAFYASIVPVMVSFLTFAAATGAVPNAGRIASRLQGCEGKIMKNAGGPGTH